MKNEKELQTISAEEVGSIDDIKGVRPVLDDKAARITALEAQLAQMQESIRVLLTEVKKPTAFSVGGFTFNVRSLPKQDAMVAGVNSVGRAGLVLEANDGDRTYVLAKVEWDHLKQAFVLFSGKGVSQ